MAIAALRSRVNRSFPTVVSLVSYLDKWRPLCIMGTRAWDSAIGRSRKMAHWCALSNSINRSSAGIFIIFGTISRIMRPPRVTHCTPSAICPSFCTTVPKGAYCSVVWRTTDLDSQLHFESKKQGTTILSITSPSVHRFSIFFHWQIH